MTQAHGWIKMGGGAILLMGMLMGCQQVGEKEAVGTVSGAVIGGVIGAQFGHGAGSVVGAAIGAGIGGLIGNSVGNSLDDQDRREAGMAFRAASQVPVGRVIYWNNVRTGNWGSYQPIHDGHTRFDGLYCREFVSCHVINGKTERIYGAACRQPNGIWQAL